MKKIFALAIALVMVLAIAAPAMAFTSATVSEESPYELDLYLVEYDDIGFGTSFTTLPESDRGYAKNEVVAAIAELFVPDEVDAFDDYATVDFSGDNVSYDVTDNPILGTGAPVLAPKATASKGWTYTILDDALDGEATYRWLVFAKVIDDEASMTFALKTTAAAWTTAVVGSAPAVTGLDLGDYIVVDGANVFAVYADSAAAADDVHLFDITVNDDDESEELIIYDGVTPYTVVETVKGIVFVGGGDILDDEDDATYEDLMEILEDDFTDEFGFDWALKGGVVDADFFEDMAGSDNIEVSVDIAPWTAYVTVPDNIVVDPPKTGDAASILGFVMIVLAAAAVVAVRKVRA